MFYVANLNMRINNYYPFCVARAHCAGIGCHTECSGHGACDSSDQCQCDSFEGYKGDLCDELGCPGWPENCMGHGTCNKATGDCDCEPGYMGTACDLLDCPGSPDCNSVENALCVLLEESMGPVCRNCSWPYMGDGCEYTCVHGSPVEEVPGEWVCECDGCYTGTACDSYCSGHADNCTNGVCDCGYDGWRGVNCEVQGCPGWGEDCSGRGTCNSAIGQCMCQSGWGGEGCNSAFCTANCNYRGDCEVVDDIPECQCDTPYFGRACEYYCYHGVATAYNCTCDPCYHGYECDVKCSGVGNCTEEGACDCGFLGARGEFCDEMGCPGLYNADCSDHGYCIIGQCMCSTGWEGVGCQIPKCPEDCNNRGTCATDMSVPYCTECVKDWMGSACEEPCNGTQTPMDSGICICDDNCTHGLVCEHVCSGAGACVEDECSCDKNATTGLNYGHYGEFCEDESCPGMGTTVCSDHGTCNKLSLECVCDSGWYGVGCHLPDCPGEPDCNDHGNCSAVGAIPECVCWSGWMGLSCDIPCVQGHVVYTDDTAECECHACFSGPACDSLCNTHGVCYSNSCVCDTAWWGE